MVYESNMLGASNQMIGDELKSLFAQSARAESHAVVDQIFEHQKTLLSDRVLGEIMVIRASSPNVMVIHPHMDTHINIFSDQNMTTLNLCPFGREQSTFGFNMGVEALKMSNHEWTQIPPDIEAAVLDRLPINQVFSDHGDLPRWLRMARTDEAGSMMVKIDDDSGSYSSDEHKLSAFFSEVSDGQGLRKVEHHIMTGLWTLGLALKIQEQARASGTVYDLLRLGKNELRSGNREGISRMLLALDQ